MNNDPTNVEEVGCENMVEDGARVIPVLCSRPVQFRVEGQLLCARCAMDYVHQQLRETDDTIRQLELRITAGDERIAKLQTALQASRAQDAGSLVDIVNGKPRL